MARSSLIAVFLVAFGLGAPAQGRVSIDEILVLLGAGVPAADVDGLVARRGAPAAVEEGDLQVVRDAGGNAGLVRRLESRLQAHQRLRDLASRFDVWQHRDAGVSLLHPKGWIVAPSVEGGRVLVTIQRDAAPARSWFRTPQMFVWVQRGTPFPRTGQPELAVKIARLVEARLRAAGMDPRGLVASLARLGGQPAPEHRMAATVPGVRFEGRLVLRTRVLDDGTVVTAGYSAADGDAEEVRALFSELARSLTVGSAR